MLDRDKVQLKMTSLNAALGYADREGIEMSPEEIVQAADKFYDFLYIEELPGEKAPVVDISGLN